MTKPVAAVTLEDRHKPTGRTRHFCGNRELDAPASLHVVQFDGEPGFYLLYLDSAGKEMTDTYHDDLWGALEQARWEFSVEKNDWTFEPGYT